MLEIPDYSFYNSMLVRVPYLISIVQLNIFSNKQLRYMCMQAQQIFLLLFIVIATRTIA